MLSIPHLIIVFVVALVVFGPDKLPDLARNLGKIMGEFKRATGDLRSTFEGHLKDLEREADQRRIDGGKTSSTPMMTPLPPSPGTIPASPPNLFTGAPEDEFPAQAPETPAIAAAPHEAAAASSEPAVPPVVDPTDSAQHETVSDGHSRPA
jgi:sec-independent protein translocase protein TatB